MIKQFWRAVRYGAKQALFPGNSLLDELPASRQTQKLARLATVRANLQISLSTRIADTGCPFNYSVSHLKSMSVGQTSVVDAIGINLASGAVHLTISDHLQWDQAHLLTLQDKINSYLAFIESGEIFVAYPQSRERDIQIDVVMKFMPTKEAFAFLQQAETIIEEAGILFGYGPGASGYEANNG